MNHTMKTITAGAALLLVLLSPLPVLALEFDVWKTGMPLTEMVATAKAHNIALTRAGVISRASGFDPRYIDERFWRASAVGYVTKLLGVTSTVRMKMAPEQPRPLYAIEIMMTGSMVKKEFYPVLIDMFTDKYGPPNKTTGRLKKTYQWTFNDSEQIELKLFSAPILTYTDGAYKHADQASSGERQQQDNSGQLTRDADKF